MRIAIFDYRVIARNPAGSCHLALLRALAQEHEFTVFSVQSENPDPQRITWVRVPVPLRPMALLFISFHVIAPILYLWHRLIRRKPFDLVQSVESNLSFGELIYAHFSHTTYLKARHPGASGIRGFLRWADHVLHAMIEPLRFHSARRLVVPSRGLQRELQSDFKLAETKVEVISNPIAVHNFQDSKSFDRQAFRDGLKFEPSDVVCVFIALGHFERKGLPLLLDALRSPELHAVKLIVVGGERDLIETYLARASRMGVNSQMRFVGFQQDARPYLWCADAFVLPSSYETFSLAAYEAAAAGLPVIAPPLNGISDLLVDGKTGFLIEPNIESITGALLRLLHTSPAERMKIGLRAQQAAAAYSTERFVESWRDLYLRWPMHRSTITYASATRVPPAA
jgi:glycosyltransferase involved in cell wall biosynthesis